MGYLTDDELKRRDNRMWMDGFWSGIAAMVLVVVVAVVVAIVVSL